MKVIQANREQLVQAEKISAVAFFGQTEFHLGEEAFERAYEKKRVTAWGRTYLALDEEGTPVSTIACNDYTVCFDGNPVGMSGIGNVATCPHRRNQGGVRACFEHALAEMEEKGQYLTALHPFSNGYYTKFGYTPISPVVRYRMSTRFMPKQEGGTCRLLEKGEDPAELAGLWNRYAAGYNMMSLRTPEEMAKYREYDPYHSDRQLYLFYGVDGELKACASFKKIEIDGRPSVELPREDFAFADAEGLREILSLAGRFSATYEYVVFELPQAFPAELYLPEIVLGHPSMEKYYCGMARVTAAAPILKMAAYRGNGEAVVRIRDEILGSNDGSFRVVYREGKCISVERTDSTPMLDLTIHDFTALILGMYDLDEYRAARSLPALDPALYGVFYRKGCFLREFF